MAKRKPRKPKDTEGRQREPVPITPRVLKWAIADAGYTTDDFASRLRVPLSRLERWTEGEEQPPITAFRRMATLLKRTPSFFFLPEPPATSQPSVEFRHPPGASRSDLNTVERHAIREASRLQDAIEWVQAEIHEEAPQVPRVRLDTNAETAAADTRIRLTGSPNGEFSRDWPSASRAFTEWRRVVERSGVLVFLFPLGQKSCAGFSLWADKTPLIAVNTAWNVQARAFTLFHEYGHLLTRTSSACLEGSGRRSVVQQDTAERWCEQFSAAFLMPRQSVAEEMRSLGWTPGTSLSSLAIPRKIAARFKVSLRAATIRAIELGAATWSLYAEIPAYTDDKPKGGGGEGRDLGQIREDQYGDRVIRLFTRALREDVLGRGDVLDYLDIPDAHLDRWERRAVVAG